MGALERELADHYTKYPRPSQPTDMVIHSQTIRVLEIDLVLYLHNFVGSSSLGRYRNVQGHLVVQIKRLVPDRRCRKRADSGPSAMAMQWQECADIVEKGGSVFGVMAGVRVTRVL
jgi:hypothetical protein